MTNERRVLVHENTEALGSAVAARMLTKVIDLLDEHEEVNLVLSGGSAAELVLPRIAADPARTTVDWSRVHFWWVDERFVSATDADRNDRPVIDGPLAVLGVPAKNIHSMGTTEKFATAEDAAVSYTKQLESASDDGELPRIDIALLGVGPDGHVASLFPGLPGISVRQLGAVAVHHSPKPPSDRISLTRTTINTFDRLFIVIAGAQKASVLGLALAGAHYTEVPVAGIKGRRRTVFFVDRDAAAEVPRELISTGY